MLTRRALLYALSCLSVARRAAGAQTARVGVLLANAPPKGPAPGVLEAFEQGLRELGHIEGSNLVLERRWGDNHYDRLDALARELVRARVDVIFASTSQSAHAAKRATQTIPIVFETLGDPATIGLVSSLARPGGNITGVSGITAQISGKRLHLLKEAVPRITRVAVLVHPENLTGPVSFGVMEPTARMLGVDLRRFHVRQVADLAPAFAEMARQKVDGLIVLADPLLFSQQPAIVELAARYRLPAMYPDTRRWIDAGGLMMYGAELADLWRRAAAYVDRILKGARPGDLPIEQPTRFELVINKRAARAIGLTLPPAMLARADEVIE